MSRKPIGHSFPQDEIRARAQRHGGVELRMCGLISGGQRTGDSPRAPVNAIGGVSTGMRQRADPCRAGQLSNDEKITWFDAVPHTDTGHLLPRFRDVPLCVIIPPLLHTQAEPPGVVKIKHATIRSSNSFCSRKLCYFPIYLLIFFGNFLVITNCNSSENGIFVFLDLDENMFILCFYF
jgi:hypothetical protein